MADSIDAQILPKRKPPLTPEQKQRRKEWLAVNADKVRQYQKKHYDSHADQRRKQGREHNRLRRLENPNHDKEVRKRYCERHPDRVKATAEKSRIKNRAALAERQRKWRRDHPGYQKEQDAKKLLKNPRLHSDRYAKDKEKLRRNAAEWRKNNPHLANDINNRNQHRRRTRIAASSENYTVSEIRHLRKKHGKQCAFCGKKGRTTIDHIRALALGGNNSIRNIQFLCRSCNSSKQDRDEIEFAQSRGLLL